MRQCAVRRLRVAAASEPAARHFVTTLEDALRSATLPGDDRRVVVVRRLALGRVAHDAGTQALGLLIEQRLARGEIAWAAADAPPDARADADADAVGFACALEARVQLARRLVRGEPCDAWYWPLAVREYRRDLTPRDALLRIAQAISALPEGRVALPQWIAQVVDAGGAVALSAAIDEAAARALLRAADIAWPVNASASIPPQQRNAQPVHTDAPRAAGLASASAQPSPPTRASTAASTQTRPAWLVEVLARAYGGTYISTAAAISVAGDDGAARARSALPATGGSASMSGNEDRPAMPSPPAPLRTPALHSRESPPPTMHATKSAQQRTAAASPDADGHWQPTACGGLLFLLPVLAHAGLVQGDSPDDDRAAVLRVLRAVLRRVRAADDDAAWALVADLPVLRPSGARAAEERALRDLAAARRWLQRRARLGLVTLVRRPAHLAFTATHIDVRFPLAGADVRVRRAGLDIDPGWLAWFGRVVAFQFVGRLP